MKPATTKIIIKYAFMSVFAAAVLAIAVVPSLVSANFFDSCVSFFACFPY
jgi:hypothetical protein